MPLRLRLALVYTVLLALSLAVLSVAVYIVARNDLLRNVDEDLGVEADSAVAVIQPAQGPVTVESLSAAQRSRLDSKATEEEEAGLGGEILFQVRDFEASVIYSSFQAGASNLPLPDGIALPDQSSYYSTDVLGKPYRVHYRPITQDGQAIGGLVIASSLSSTHSELNTLRDIFVGGGLAVLLFSTVPSYVLAGRILRPVRRVSGLARDIESTADFSRRVPVTPAGDELSELARTFNAMIERVELVLGSQKAFLADSSHELRRPLTVLRADLGVLSEPGLSDESRKAIVREMTRETELMTRLIADLLLLSREGREEMLAEPVDYSALCREALERLESRDAGHHIVKSKIASGVHVLGDHERLSGVLDNLLENAAQYTSEGGEIRLDLALTEGSARVTITDTGGGISEQDLPHVFDRFFRADSARSRSSEHSGLGLAIVKHIVEAHGGSIAVVSQLGVGTTFSVDLPVSSGPDPALH